MSNSEVVVMRSAQRFGSTFSADQINTEWRGARLFLEVSAVSGTLPALDVKVQFRDPATGIYHDLPGATFAQKTGISTDELSIYPGNTAMANRAVSGPMPFTWRVAAAISGTNTPSFTFSVGASLQI